MKSNHNTKTHRSSKPILGLLKIIVFLAVIIFLALLIDYQIKTASNAAKLKQEITYQHQNADGPRKIGLNSQELVELNKISPILILAVLVGEDQKFVAHSGFDLGELKSSLIDSVFKGRKLRGASTIDQQLSRTLFLNSSRTLLRKLKEAVYTYNLNRIYSKREILTLYLNAVEWGPNVYGIKEAADFYFKKAPLELNLEESAFLSALLPSPVQRAKFKNKIYQSQALFKALERRLVLTHLAKQKLLTKHDLSALNFEIVLHDTINSLIGREIMSGQYPVETLSASNKSLEMIQSNPSF